MRSKYSYFNEPFGRSYEPDFETIPEFQSAVEPSNLQQAAVISSPQPYESATVLSTPVQQTAPQTGRTEDPQANMLTPFPVQQTDHGLPSEDFRAQNQTQPAAKDNTLLYAGIGAGVLLIIVLVLILKKKK
ncbi:hypothetical protein [Rhodoflexus sp.]